MQCDRAAELVGAYLDQELEAETRREIAAHLADAAAETIALPRLAGRDGRLGQGWQRQAAGLLLACA